MRVPGSRHFAVSMPLPGKTPNAISDNRPVGSSLATSALPVTNAPGSSFNRTSWVAESTLAADRPRIQVLPGGKHGNTLRVLTKKRSANRPSQAGRVKTNLYAFLERPTQSIPVERGSRAVASSDLHPLAVFCFNRRPSRQRRGEGGFPTTSQELWRQAHAHSVRSSSTGAPLHEPTVTVQAAAWRGSTDSTGFAAT